MRPRDLHDPMKVPGRCAAVLVGIAIAAACAPAPKATTAATSSSSSSSSSSCFCMTWVHGDENGQSCYETEEACDAGFLRFARPDKLPCREKPMPRCESTACRNGGAECFTVP